ncbi:hypothetical protein K470DRAFT_285474 [Piedraia hortae CBS 480.64]|uniref:DUF7924 domain-containing protein n=1 Tax=Piedraia hortae CBS 480.64 TaxID=1314780 RepID=A0A6A7C204_9PEZI|nr:hypothetical protein K470DRAFT_285474 [Piedraia hortae CBS 480.64]
MTEPTRSLRRGLPDEGMRQPKETMDFIPNGIIGQINKEDWPIFGGYKVCRDLDLVGESAQRPEEDGAIDGIRDRKDVDVFGSVGGIADLLCKCPAYALAAMLESNKVRAPFPTNDVKSKQQWNTRLNIVLVQNEDSVRNKISRMLLPEPVVVIPNYNETQGPISYVSSQGWVVKIRSLPKKPKHDVPYGMSWYAFNEAHRTRLKPYTRYRPADFTKSWHCFPLLVDKIKGASGKNTTCRNQANATASTAVEAIVHLCEYIRPDGLAALEGKLLCFGVQQNHQVVEIFRHLFFRKGDRSFYYMISLYKFLLSDDIIERADVDGRVQCCSRTLAITHASQEHHYPRHEKLILGLVNDLMSIPTERDKEDAPEAAPTARTQSKRPASASTIGTVFVESQKLTLQTIGWRFGIKEQIFSRMMLGPAIKSQVSSRSGSTSWKRKSRKWRKDMMLT